MTKKKQRKNGSHPSGEKKEIAISVKNVNKTFQVPHQKVDSMRSVFVNMFQKKTFEEFHALDDVSFEVEKGQFVGIIGHNGSGKSTLLKVLSHVYEADGGTVDINGQISPFLELGIGFNPELSGRDNIYLNATILGLSQQEVDDKFDKIVAFSEIGEFIDQQVKNYSSGMKARLAFSVSIHANREILIMDEVLAVGDSRFQQKCMNVFKGYKKEGKTVILVTHSVATVREYCDKALLLHHGKMIKSGDVDEVCDEYIERNMTEDQRQAAIKKESLEKAEEKRVKQFEKEKKNKEQDTKKEEAKKIKEKKNRKAIITEVKAYDSYSNKLSRITAGDDIFIDIEIDVREKDSGIFLAVQFFDKETNYFICGNNTDTDQFDCDFSIGRNTIRISFEDVVLNVGVIYVKAVLFKKGKNDDNIIFETFDSSESENFLDVIRDKATGGGIITMNHNWNRQ